MIDILLALHNGAEFLEEFVASLSRQTLRDFQLVVFDDASRDRSAELLRELCSRYGIAIAALASSPTSRGVAGAFGEALALSAAEYVCLADQDDRWHPEKLEMNLARMRETEARHGKAAPLLVHSDLRVCDRDMNVLHPSFFAYQRISPGRHALKDLLVQNSVTGCTVMMNRALADSIPCFPEGTIFHDWFIALVASAFGSIECISRPLVDYRQHGNNCLGAVKYDGPLLVRTMRSGRRMLHERLLRAQRQAWDFAECYRLRLSPEQYELALCWAELSGQSYPVRLLLAVRNRFVKNTLPRTLGMWWAL